MGKFDYSRLQAVLLAFLFNHEREWNILVLPAQQLRVSPTRVRILSSASRSCPKATPSIPQDRALSTTAISARKPFGSSIPKHAKPTPGPPPPSSLPPIPSPSPAHPSPSTSPRSTPCWISLLPTKPFLTITLLLTACHPPPPDPLPLPDTVLWAWEHPEDLRALNPRTTAVAFLAATLNLSPAPHSATPP